MNRIFIFIFIPLLIAVASCRTSKTIRKKEIAAVISAEERERLELLQQLPSSQFIFDLLSAKSKVALTSKGKTQNITFNIRMKRDSKIWISINAIGSIEVARVLLTPDSVKVIDRINNQFLKKDYQYISNLLKTDVDFFLIQDLIVGNIPLQKVYYNSKVLTNSDNIQLEIFENPRTTTITLMKTGFKMMQLMVNDTLTLQNLKIDYADPRIVDGQSFPFLINSLANSQKESIQFNVQFVKVIKENSLDFPFNIPKRFE